MRYFLAFLLALLIPTQTFAAYGLTQSANIIKASGNSFSRADTASLSITGNLAVEAWVNVQIAPSNSFQTFASKTDGGGSRSWRFGYDDTAGTKSLYFGVSGDGSSLTAVQINQTLTVGTWYHVAAVYTTSTKLELFVNGVSIGSNTSSIPGSIFDGNDATAIGKQSDGSADTDAYVSLMRVWSTTRTATNFSDNQCSVLGATANLAAEWTLNNTVNDNSGNANTLTNNGSTAFNGGVPAICGGGSGFNLFAFMPF